MLYSLNSTKIEHRDEVVFRHKAKMPNSQCFDRNYLYICSRHQDIMNYLANKPLKFIADRYEEWSGGRCLANGPIDAVIDITVSGDVLLANINGAESLRMYSRGVYLKADESGDLGDRIQYVSPNIDMDPLNPIILHVFHQNRTISYIRFAMTAPDRIIEFYGRTVTFNGMDRPETLRFKSLFLDDLSSLYRSLLKENTVNMAVMHHQMACVAFSIKKYYTLLAMMEDADGSLKSQVFKDTFSLIAQYYPIFGNEALDDARNWYNKIVASPVHSDIFIDYYFGQAESGGEISYPEIMQGFHLT